MKKIILMTLLLSLNTYSNEEAAEALGERLFNEFRFSAFYNQKSKGNVNYQLKSGSPAVEEIETLVGLAPSPFAGTATSCASCHMVDQGLDLDGIGMRGYNDASRRTQILYRAEDNRNLTLRNTPALIGLHSKYSSHPFVHFDGELNGTKATVLGNFTGRNMGWLSNEKAIATQHLIKVIKNDNGLGELAQEFGGSYKKIFLSTDPSIDEEFKLDEKYRIDVTKASDEEIISKVEEMIFIYVKNIDFESDEDGNYSGSAYDKFLEKNNISRGPKKNQSVISYTNELIQKIKKLDNPKYIESFTLDTHNRESQFKENELKGLKTFLNLNGSKRGMCVQCHLPPLFSDTQFHNIGISQNEYDNVHGKGSFMKLKVPSLKEKEANQVTFLSIANKSDKSKADLGAWNFFKSNKSDEFSNFVRSTFCTNRSCDDELLSKIMISRFKTPSLRNLGHSAPYFHDGSAKTLEDVMQVYIDNSELSKHGELRNSAPQVRRMNIGENEVKNLSAFLRSLDEVYE
jgi:cytochrome c peroxidase